MQPPLALRNTSTQIFSVDQLDGLDASVWSTIAQHGLPIDVYSPDVQEVIDVTDGRLRNLYDAFDRYVSRKWRGLSVWRK
jgi:hypothetical protein